MTPTPASNLSDAAIFRYVQRTAGIEGLTFAEFLEHGKRTANIVSGMPYSFKYKGRAITHETDVRYIVEGLEVEMAPGRMLLTLADGHLQIESEAQFKSHYMPVLLAPVALDRAHATAEPVVAWLKPGTNLVVHNDTRGDTNKGEEFSIPLGRLGATVAPSPAPDSQEYLLRAMARNYGDGPHQWDKLDRIACERAADEIKSLRAASGASPEPTTEALEKENETLRLHIQRLTKQRDALADIADPIEPPSDHQVEAPIQLPDVNGTV